MRTGSSTLMLNEAFVLRMLRLYIRPGLWMKLSSLPLLDSPVQPSIPTFCSLAFIPSMRTFCRPLLFEQNSFFIHMKIYLLSK